MGEAADDTDLSSPKRSWTTNRPSGPSVNKSGGVLATYDTASGIIPSDNAAVNHGFQAGPSATADNEKHGDHFNDTTHGVYGINKSDPGPASQPLESEKAGASEPTVNPTPPLKRSINSRVVAGSRRFVFHTKDALLHSWINVLLIFVPVGIAVKVAGLSPAVVFAINAIAIIPLAGLLVYATESVASRLGNTLGALLNVSFGNSVELIIYIIALTKNEIRIVQASLLGSILSNLLLILGMAFLLGGLRFQEQVYNNTVTQMSACLLSLSVISLLLPTAFHASFSNTALADHNTLKISRATSVVLLIIYILYLLFQLKSHAYLYESTPQHIIDEESHPGILADVLDTSSSSNASDTSSSDTDTSGSHTTTKRIKRAFRHRRHRKSIASSTHTNSVPSTVSSPSVERVPIMNDSSALTFSIPSRRPSTMGGVGSGDEADIEHVGGRPRIRDFVDLVSNDEVIKDRREKKVKKHRKSHHKRHPDKDVSEDSPTVRKVDRSATAQGLSIKPAPIGEQVNHQASETEGQEAAKRGLLSRAPNLRPALPKMLTQNVFVTGPQSTTQPAAPPPTNTPMPARTGAYVLRRTTSLPDRLNRQQNGQAVSRQASGLPSVPAQSELPIDEDVELEEEVMSRTAAAVLLLVSTALVAVCAEFLVDSIPGMLSNSTISQEFVGLIILPIVSNAAEHFTAVTVAAKNKMDLAIGVSVGSSIQISLFVTPFIVILGWIIGRDMTLYFSLFETVCLFVTVFVVNFLVLDGRSNYLEGSLLMAAYTIIAVCAFFYPSSGDQSNIGGGA